MGPLPGSWLAARMANLTPDLQMSLSWGLIVESFHSLWSLSFSCFHVILGLPSLCSPSAYMSQTDLMVPFGRWMCPYHQSLFSFRMRSRSLMPSCACSSCDLMVAVSCGLTLQINVILKHSLLDCSLCRSLLKYDRVPNTPVILIQEKIHEVLFYVIQIFTAVLYFRYAIHNCTVGFTLKKVSWTVK